MTEILVVEDEAGIALGLRNDLRLEGYAVEVSLWCVICAGPE
jgi:DNA-binding response OmpR family regulator